MQEQQGWQLCCCATCVWWRVCDYLVIPLSLSLVDLHGTTTVPHYQLSGFWLSAVCRHKLKDKLRSLSLPQWPPLPSPSLVIPFSFTSLSLFLKIFQFHLWYSTLDACLDLLLPYDILLQPFPLLLLQLQRLQLGHLLHWTSSQLGL